MFYGISILGGHFTANPVYIYICIYIYIYIIYIYIYIYIYMISKRIIVDCIIFGTSQISFLWTQLNGFEYCYLSAVKTQPSPSCTDKIKKYWMFATAPIELKQYVRINPIGARSWLGQTYLSDQAFLTDECCKSRYKCSCLAKDCSITRKPF